MGQNNRKVALVTGASRGIGMAITERLARDGFTLIINYSGNAASAEALVRKLEGAGGHAIAVKADVSDPTAVRQMFGHIAINLKGTFNTLREAAKRLRTGGRIVNLSSTVVGRLVPTYGIYIATKAAVEGLTSVLAKELRGRNITVNAVAPGPTATELFLKGKPQDVVDNLAKMAPLERLGQPSDIADVVSFLAGPDAAWVNGQVLRVNGGLI